MNNELSRRAFLKGSAAAAVSAAFLGLNVGNAPKGRAAASYTPGTYTATATGMGTVTMTATFSETAITDVVLDVSGETPEIGQLAADTLIQQCLDAQSAEIDGVSGASLTSQAVRDCLNNCIAQAGGTVVNAVTETAPAESGPWYDAAYFAKPDPITDIAETVETDVVVVGAGNGGLVAAASAADLGAKVTLVEKNATWITWAGEMGAYNTKLMNEQYGIHYTDEELMEISNEICRYAGYECDQRLINLWLFNSGRTMDWFIDQMESKGIHMFLETDMKDCRYMNKPQTHTVYETFEELGPNMMGAQLANPKWVEIIEEKGGSILWQHSARQLVQDESGKVTGIIVQRAEDGAYVQINAAKGVVLSTGGYGGNPEMMDALHYRDKDVICNNLGCAFAMGDGIKMAMWAGADIDRNHSGGVAFDRAAVDLDHHTGAPYTSGLGDIWWPGSQPWLHLNTHGERFCNEDNTYAFHINSWLAQPGHFAFQVFDSNYWSDVQAFHTTICSRVVAVPGARNSEVLPGVMPCKDGDQFYNVYIKPALDSGKLQ